MTRGEILEAIAGITAQMKGPMPDLERRLLHEDRKDFRKMLAEMDGEETNYDRY